jgi:hypothetical protein
LKVVPGQAAGRKDLWHDADPYYGPKDQAQDIRGLEMEKKYTGMNLEKNEQKGFDWAFAQAKKYRAEQAAKSAATETKPNDK